MTTPTNPLSDLIPPRARKYVYSLAVVAGLVFSVWQVSGGDYKAFAAGLFATLIPLLAASNTPTTVAEAVAEVQDVADDVPDELVEADELLAADKDAFLDGHGS